MWTALIVGLIILIIILALIYVAKQSEPEPRPVVYDDYDEDEQVTTTVTTTTSAAKEVYNGYEIEGYLPVLEDAGGECYVNDPVGGQRQYVDRDCDMYQDDDQKFWRLSFR